MSSHFHKHITDFQRNPTRELFAQQNPLNKTTKPQQTHIYRTIVIPRASNLYLKVLNIYITQKHKSFFTHTHTHTDTYTHTHITTGCTPNRTPLLNTASNKQLLTKNRAVKKLCENIETTTATNCKRSILPRLQWTIKPSCFCCVQFKHCNFDTPMNTAHTLSLCISLFNQRRCHPLCTLLSITRCN